jgi:hypothetical protein
MPDTCLPTTRWFLYSEMDVPLGRAYRREVPEVEAKIEYGPDFASAQVISTELRATCAMRRFKVVVRVLT